MKYLLLLFFIFFKFFLFSALFIFFCFLFYFLILSGKTNYKLSVSANLNSTNGQWYHTRLLQSWHGIIIIVAEKTLHFFFACVICLLRRNHG